MIRALILSGDGINCEVETAHACRLAGFDVEVMPVARLISKKMSQRDLESNYKLVVLPGGFSFGDDLGSGRVFSLKIKKGLSWDLNQFTEKGGLVLGICNGFQTLIRLGVFGHEISITKNASNQFIDRWVKLQTEVANESPWLKDYTEFELPIRHGEGRVLFSTQSKNSFSVALRYHENINGSQENIAGLTNLNGRILGLMPHPEAYVVGTQHPTWTKNKTLAESSGFGLLLFKNAYKELSQNGAQNS